MITPASLPTAPADPEAALLARAYRLVMSWPCPECGKPYPCPHDLAPESEIEPTPQVEALRQLGAMLKDAPKATGTKGQLLGKNSSGGARVEPPEETTPTYADLGLDKKTAASADNSEAANDSQDRATASESGEGCRKQEVAP